MEIIPVTHVSEVLKIALTRAPEPIEWDEEAEEAAALAAAKPSDDGAGAVAH
jgi:ATP-dependent Lon protease